MDCDKCGALLSYSHKTTRRCETEYEESGVIGRASTNQDMYVFECEECDSDPTHVKFFSLTIRPQRAENIDEVLRFCRDEGIIGLGWGVENRSFENPESYLRYRRDEEGEPGKIKRDIKDFVIWMEPDDIVFLYDKPTSQYYLAQVEGEWSWVNDAELSESKRREFKRNDIWQFRDATWHKMQRKYLTGDVLSGTPPPMSTLQKKDFNEKQAKYLALLPGEPDVDADADFEALQDRLHQEAFGNNGDPENLLRRLSEEELETIVVSYVQRHNDAVLMQNTTNDDLPDVESLLRTTGDDGRPVTIGTQVTRGGLSNKGDLKNFLKHADELYIYANGDTKIAGATELIDREIAEYMCDYIAELPPSALLRLEVIYG